MLPPKNVKTLHTAIVILVLFEQFLRQVLFKFLPLILSLSPHMMQFVFTFSIYASLSREDHGHQKGTK